VPARRGIVRASLVALLVGWLVTFRPTVLGGPASYILVGGQSMEPTIHTGSLVVAFSNAEYRIGDVVVYRVPEGDPAGGRLVIHRIVGGSAAAGFILQGDNAPATDIWRPVGTDVVGRASFVVPALADLIVFVRSPVVIASLAAALASYCVLWAAMSLSPPARVSRLP
jgi:signal peptidase